MNNQIKTETELLKEIDVLKNENIYLKAMHEKDIAERHRAEENSIPLEMEPINIEKKNLDIEDEAPVGNIIFI